MRCLFDNRTVSSSCCNCLMASSFFCRKGSEETINFSDPVVQTAMKRESGDNQTKICWMHLNERGVPLHRSQISPNWASLGSLFMRKVSNNVYRTILNNMIKLLGEPKDQFQVWLGEVFEMCNHTVKKVLIKLIRRAEYIYSSSGIIIKQKAWFTNYNMFKWSD